MTRKELLDQAIDKINEYEAADIEADHAEEVHADSVVKLQDANEKAAKDNQAAEQQLLNDESAASAAYDLALQDAKSKREQVRRDGEKLVQDAQVDEGTKLNLAQEARATVLAVFGEIRDLLQAAADTTDTGTPVTPVEATPVTA